MDDAVAKGAVVKVGGKMNPDLSAGQFYPPTVIVGVTHDMRMAKEEVFGRGTLVHFSTRLELFFGIGGARRDRVARVKGVFMVCRVFLFVRHGSS